MMCMYSGRSAVAAAGTIVRLKCIHSTQCESARERRVWMNVRTCVGAGVRAPTSIAAGQTPGHYSHLSSKPGAARVMTDTPPRVREEYSVFARCIDGGARRRRLVLAAAGGADRSAQTR